jgi:hypothetical protein
MASALMITKQQPKSDAPMPSSCLQYVHSPQRNALL